LGVLSEKVASIESKVDFSDYPIAEYDRKLELLSFFENVILYFALGTILGYYFRYMSLQEFTETMLKVWGFGYSVGIPADALLINRGYYLPAYNKFKGTPFLKILKFFLITIYHSAWYAVFGMLLGRFIL
jgi:integrase